MCELLDYQCALKLVAEHSVVCLAYGVGVAHVLQTAVKILESHQHCGESIVSGGVAHTGIFAAKCVDKGALQEAVVVVHGLAGVEVLKDGEPLTYKEAYKKIIETAHFFLKAPFLA